MIVVAKPNFVGADRSAFGELQQLDGWPMVATPDLNLFLNHAAAPVKREFAGSEIRFRIRRIPLESEGQFAVLLTAVICI